MKKPVKPGEVIVYKGRDYTAMHEVTCDGCVFCTDENCTRPGDFPALCGAHHVVFYEPIAAVTNKLTQGSKIGRFGRGNEE